MNDKLKIMEIPSRYDIGNIIEELKKSDTERYGVIIYSNGISYNQRSGRVGYYAERCPDVSETSVVHGSISSGVCNSSIHSLKPNCTVPAAVPWTSMLP